MERRIAIAFFAACLFYGAAPAPSFGASDLLPIIDAHSQFDQGAPPDRVIRHAAMAGVTQVLLSARGRVTTAQVLELSSRHGACIVPSVRTKGRQFDEDQPGYYALLDEQFKEQAFRAMSEIILAHAAKGKLAPEVNVPANSPQVQEAIRRAAARGWPVVLHYEFRWLAAISGNSGRAKRMAEMKALLIQNPQTVFALIHMAQLDPGDVAELIAAHPNLVFLTSHANRLVVAGSKQPWTDMFLGSAFAPAWRALMVQHSDRFVLAFDNVWPEHWSEKYAEQVALWREALSKLPTDVAHAVAHRNAERLWKLAPAAAGEGCATLAQSLSR